MLEKRLARVPVCALFHVTIEHRPAAGANTVGEKALVGVALAVLECALAVRLAVGEPARTPVPVTETSRALARFGLVHAVSMQHPVAKGPLHSVALRRDVQALPVKKAAHKFPFHALAGLGVLVDPAPGDLSVQELAPIGRAVWKRVDPTAAVRHAKPVLGAAKVRHCSMAKRATELAFIATAVGQDLRPLPFPLVLVKLAAVQPLAFQQDALALAHAVVVLAAVRVPKVPVCIRALPVADPLDDHPAHHDLVLHAVIIEFVKRGLRSDQALLCFVPQRELEQRPVVKVHGALRFILVVKPDVPRAQLALLVGVHQLELELGFGAALGLALERRGGCGELGLQVLAHLGELVDHESPLVILPLVSQ
mmetsp:Transcript_6155/g.19964  ORF Transcript_6155/g.19964 Transcript_6155/m.19964 type:complete len:366 (-) Transcript_6155:615-1712(-)